jgi:hypothetical protein
VRGAAAVWIALSWSGMAWGQMLEGGVAGAARGVAGGADRPLSAEDRKHIAELDSSVLRVRESAMSALRNSPLLTLDQLEGVLSGERLSPEQFNRLGVLAKERFVSSPRAALGVQFDDFGARSSEGVPIARTIEGFDSVRVLKSGDVMYAMSGVRVTSLEDARKIITSHDPGERMTIHLFRNGEPLIVRATLGNFEDLERRPERGRNVGVGGGGGNRGGRGSDVMDAAWEIRLARVMGTKMERAEAIDPGVGVAEYSAMEGELGRVVDLQEKRERVKTVARQDGMGEEVDRGPGIVAGGGAGGVVGIEATAEFSGSGRATPENEAALQAQRSSLQLELNNINMMMMQAQLDPKKRQALAQQSMRVRVMIMELDGKLAKEKMNRRTPPKP